MGDYFDLGSYARPVTTSSEQARLWFGRGLLWTYGFNHEEAVACFERAVEADPDCALAYWGVAYALGPNYNKAWEAFDPDDLTASLTRAHAAAGQASDAAARVPGVSPAERALIGALAARYPAAEPGPDLEAWDQAYADAMRAVYQEHSDDPDVAGLFAEALLQL